MYESKMFFRVNCINCNHADVFKNSQELQNEQEMM